MPRPAKKETEKRKVIAPRFDPEDRKAIEDYAALSSRSAGAEVERRVRATLAFDEEGLSLLEELGSEIAEIEAGLGGSKRWHQQLKKWSAVVDMFRTGPIMRRNPDSPDNDPAVEEAYRRVSELEKKRKDLVAEASQIGLAWLEDPKRNALAPGVVGNALASFSFNPRAAERTTLENLPATEARDYMIGLHEQVCALDQEITDARRSWTTLLAHYWKVEREGRKWNRERQQAKAREAFQRGERVDYYQLTGRDPWQLEE